MKVSWRGLLLGLLLATPLPALAQDESRERFQLFTRCAAMDLEMTLEDRGDVLGSLTIDEIEQAVRSRLRAARVYREDANYLLVVRVDVVDRAFQIGLQYFKPVHDPVSDVRDFAATWQTGRAGTHGSDAGFVISSISRAMDRFLDEYLRVNEAGCGAAWRSRGTG